MSQGAMNQTGMTGASAAWLPGYPRRLHLQHGPIDLVIQADGVPAAVAAAYDRAWARFQTILTELVSELALLRTALPDPSASTAMIFPRGHVARRMVAACLPYAVDFITPMAAVAGSVADEILAAMRDGAALDRIYVNNGGDIALHLAPGQSLRIGLVTRDDAPELGGFAELRSADASRGIATSGWRGRSFSRGIADAVTVLACNAAQADAAATIIANAVNAEHPNIVRAPANSIHDDSDLGEIPVTVTVGTLPISLMRQALSAGATVAHDLRRRGLIHAAHLVLGDCVETIGGASALPDAALEMVS
ncbi:UPF0280 family protein [Ferrovibrio sp.]|uniref:UPF0280 family protein n=1 Tax=Ferrovibrio sp. TaxID=1917215 RepID=UPI0025C48BB0|nr:UPF0280 family protein [Ferrovibrio sp.]